MYKRGTESFTIIELLVSIAIVSLILLVLASITSQTEVIWKATNSKIDQYRSARDGFDTLTASLSQATLNTYLGYSDGVKGDNFYSTTAAGTAFTPTTYARQSELRFLSGSCSAVGSFAGTLTGMTGSSATLNPTHSVFFLAPLGYSTTSTYKPLTQVLNVWGYYLQFGSDSSLPSFFTSAFGYQPRYRYRLMEFLEPSENNSIYYYTTSTGTSTPYGWITAPLNSTTPPPPVHILAENIIALIILPKLGQDQKTSAGTPFSSYALAPTYSYDSTNIGAAATDPTDAGALNSNNQLPPVVQVTMVAIDEPSAIRIQKSQASSSTAPNFGLSTLFQDASKYAADLDQLKANLQQSTLTDTTGTYVPTVTLPQKIRYQIFTTNVSIKAAQWSTIQTN